MNLCALRRDFAFFFSSLSLESAKLLKGPFEGVVSLTTVQVYDVLLPLNFCSPFSRQNLPHVQLCIAFYSGSRAADSMFNLYLKC